MDTKKTFMGDLAESRVFLHAATMETTTKNEKIDLNPLQ